MSKRWIYPGSFDPFTAGHLDIVRRAAALCDHLIVALLPNPEKQAATPVEQRVHWIETCVADCPNVEVAVYNGLLADYVKAQNADAVVRGVRSGMDCAYEVEQANINRMLFAGYEAVFLPCRPEWIHTRSTVVREVAKRGGDISAWVPDVIKHEVFDWYANRR